MAAGNDFELDVFSIVHDIHKISGYFLSKDYAIGIAKDNEHLAVEEPAVMARGRSPTSVTFDNAADFPPIRMLVLDWTILYGTDEAMDETSDCQIAIARFLVYPMRDFALFSILGPSQRLSDFGYGGQNGQR